LNTNLMDEVNAGPTAGEDPNLKSDASMPRNVRLAS